MTSPKEILFLFDVDNTLLDNDRVQLDLRNHLEREFGVESRDRYWAIFEELQTELGYADYLGALPALPARVHVRSATADDVFVPGGLSVCESVVSWFA